MGEGAGKRGGVLLKRVLPKKKKRLCMSGRRLLPADAGGLDLPKCFWNVSGSDGAVLPGRWSL